MLRNTSIQVTRSQLLYRWFQLSHVCCQIVRLSRKQLRLIFGPLAGLTVCHWAWAFTNSMLLGLMSLGYIQLCARIQIFQSNMCQHWHYSASSAGDVWVRHSAFKMVNVGMRSLRPGRKHLVPWGEHLKYKYQWVQSTAVEHARNKNWFKVSGCYGTQYCFKTMLIISEMRTHSPK